MVRRILDENAGLLKEITDVLALEALKNPLLFPVLPKSEQVVMFSDYSIGSGEHKTYSFLVTSSSEVTRFNDERLQLRANLKLQNRRMSFKGLNDGIKLKSLPAFLHLAGTLSGFLITFAVDSADDAIFADLFREISPELASLKRRTLEELLRIAFFGSIALLVSTHDNKPACWFTDNDNIVATETLRNHFGKIVQSSLNMMYSNANAPTLAFGTTAIDAGTLDLEDLVAIPDLMAGAVCELLDRMAFDGTSVKSKLCLKPPKVSPKTDSICAWAAEPSRKLSNFAISIQRSSSKDGWSPTFFSIQQDHGSLCIPNTGFGVSLWQAA